jgi:hypothetical protein
MDKKTIGGFILLAIIIFTVFSFMGIYLVNDSMKNPQLAGDRFGPYIHFFSRIFPLPISEQESTSFQGLTMPRSQPDKILVYDITELSEQEQIQVKVVQGLMNREKPTLYLINSENTQFWLSQIDAEKELIYHLDYSEYVKIKYDINSVKQKYLAITLSGLYDAIPVTESDEFMYDLTSLSDEELNKMFLEVSTQANKDMISFRSGKIDNIDFIVKNKMLISPLAISDRSLFKLERVSVSEAKISQQIISQMNPDCAMVGYNINPGIAGEVEMMNFLSENGCFSVPVPNVPNLSFFSGLPKEDPSHETIESNIQLENKTYMVILMSDGDNIDLPYRRYDSFSQPHKTPLVWSISPFLNEFSPTMFNHYSSNLPQGDSFVVAPSGGGFGYPSKNKYLPAFIEHTDIFMNELNLEYIWLLDHPLRGYSPVLLDKFAQISKGMFMEYAIIRHYDNSIEFYGDTPAVFSAAFIEKKGDIAKSIILRTPQEKPAFLVIGVEMRYNSPQHIDSEIALLDPELYEVVSAPEFFDLVKQTNNL